MTVLCKDIFWLRGDFNCTTMRAILQIRLGVNTYVYKVSHYNIPVVDCTASPGCFSHG